MGELITKSGEVYSKAHSRAANLRDRATVSPRMNLQASCEASKAICSMKCAVGKPFIEHKNMQTNTSHCLWMNLHVAKI